MATNIILGIIAFLMFLNLVSLRTIGRKVADIKTGNISVNDVTLIDEVMNYIASKGKTPILGEDNYEIQYFAYTNENNEIVNITPIEDIEYKAGSINWKKRRAELFKIVDKFMEENK